MNEFDVWDDHLFNVFDVVFFHQDLDDLRFDFVTLFDGLNQNVIPSLDPNVLTKFCRHRDLENDRIVESLQISHRLIMTMFTRIIRDHFLALKIYILSSCFQLSGRLYDLYGVPLI